MKNTDLLIYGLVGAAIYFLYQKGTQATQYTASAIASIWTSLVDPPGVGALLGNITLPDGSSVPLQGTPIKQLPNGGVVANVNGTLYQLQPSDANGNWPAVPLP